jgi:hypothetical protein
VSPTLKTARRPGSGPEVGTIDRAFALAAVRALGPEAASLCARVRPAALTHARTLLADPSLLEAECQALAAPHPQGLSEVHPSWYEAPQRSDRPAAAVYLSRVAYGHLVGMTDARRTGGGEPPSLPEAGEALAHRLRQLGVKRVAVAFSGAPRSALAQLCARLGEPDASHLLEEIRSVPRSVTAEEVTAAQRELFDGAGPIGDGESPETLFVRVGCGCVAPGLTADGDGLRRMAQRLPRTVGELLLASAERAPLAPTPRRPL